MVQAPKPRNAKITALVFGLIPCVLGLGAAQLMRWTDTVWLTTAGGFWPIILTACSVGLAIRLLFSDFEDKTSGISAWLTLFGAWFSFPLWITAIEVPYSAAVVTRGGQVHVVSKVARYPEYRVRFLTNHAGMRIVHDVVGNVVTDGMGIEYRYAEPYIATRRHEENLAEPLIRAASGVLGAEAQRPRSSRIALLEDRAVQGRVLETICSAAVGGGIPCPLKMKLLPQSEAMGLGATWSLYYTEKEAIAEKHLPTLVRLLTLPESTIDDRDAVFALVLELAESSAVLAQVAQSPFYLSDEQFNVLIGRILASPDCGDDVIGILIKANRLDQEQRQALRAKALREASMAHIVAHATPLRISDAEIAELSPRTQAAFLADPGVAVLALEVFGERLSPDTQRDAVAGAVRGKAAHALAALAHVNFSIEHRHELMKKVLSDADHGDFSAAGLTKERLQAVLRPKEMRALIAMAVSRSETSKEWLEFSLTSLPIRAMTITERKSLLTGSLFESPKSALEFVSKNRPYLEPAEVNEITRDYTRTITTDFCLHLSHRNKNWRTDYFSEDQLQIFRDCAETK